MRAILLSAWMTGAAVLGPMSALVAGSPGTGTPARPPHSDHPYEGVPERFPEHPAVGEVAPDFQLRDTEGRQWALGEYLGRGYLALMFGSASSAQFRTSAPGLDRLARDWERLEVRALIVYTREAHPATLKGEAPRDYPQRAALARRTREEMKVKVRFLVDEWNDAVHKAYGAMPDAAFLLDSRGTIVLRQPRADPAALRKELSRLLRVTEPP